MRHLKWLKQIDSSQVPCKTFFRCYIFIIKESLDVYAKQKIKRGKETERVCIACGSHYFWRAPRLGELENIILSGWFDSAMKNVRSGDDKSWCWGEGTGRQGMSFVMSAIWLHPPPPLPFPPSYLLFHISPFLSPLLIFHLRCLPFSPFLSLFHCNDLFEHVLLPLIFLHPPSYAPLLCQTIPNIISVFQVLTLTALQHLKLC